MGTFLPLQDTETAGIFQTMFSYTLALELGSSIIFDGDRDDGQGTSICPQTLKSR